MILGKVGFDSRIFLFFSSYLIDRQTQYIWNNFVSSFFRVDVDVGQRLVFFSILFILYITPIFHIFKKRNSSLLSPIFISTLFFVDDGLFISQEKNYKKSNTNLFYNYSIISSLFKQFCLTVEHNKLEIFYFSMIMKNFNLPSLNLRLLGGSFL